MNNNSHCGFLLKISDYYHVPKILLVLFLFFYSSALPQVLKINGVKVYFTGKEIKDKYKPDFVNFISDLKESKINTLFTPVYEGEKSFYKSSLFNKNDQYYDLIKLRQKLKQNKIKFGAICQVFYDPDIINKRKDLIPVDQDGADYYENWQKLVCPSDIEYKKYKLSVIEEIAWKFHPDFISLDFIRFPIVWEKINFAVRAETVNSSLNEMKQMAKALNTAKLKGFDAVNQEFNNLKIQPETTENKTNQFDTLRNFCFCSRCVKSFSEKYNISIPAEFKTTKEISGYILTNKKNEWYEWKSGLISEFVREVYLRIKKIDPKIKINLHLIPWDKDILDNGLYRLAGQDINRLKHYVDYFSPMIYNKMIGLPDNYIHTFSTNLYNETGIGIIPNIQSNKIINENEVIVSEFDDMLTNALSSPSSGVLLFSWNKLIPAEGESSLIWKKRDLLKEKFGDK